MNNFRNIILFRHFLGQQKKGVANAPELFYNKMKNDNFSFHNVKCGDNDPYDNLKNLYSVNEYINGKRLNIGGDHSMAISTVAHSLNKYPDIKIIWFDAHPDINTRNRSVSKNLHGMPLSFLTGLDDFNKFGFIKNKLDFKNLLYVGIRDIDDFEKDILEKNEVKVISVNEFNNNILKSERILKKFVKNSPFHLSFDVDSIDPAYIPCTGTPVNNGLIPKQVKPILNNLLNMKNCYNVDITELNVSEDNFTDHDIKKSLETINNILDL